MKKMPHPHRDADVDTGRDPARAAHRRQRPHRAPGGHGGYTRSSPSAIRARLPGGLLVGVAWVANGLGAVDRPQEEHEVAVDSYFVLSEPPGVQPAGPLWPCAGLDT